MRPSVGLTTIALLMASCAARGPSPALVAEVGKADVALNEGCYRCLEDALQAFERVAADPRAPGRAKRGAFEAALLLAVRSKELGLPFPRRFTWMPRSISSASCQGWIQRFASNARADRVVATITLPLPRAPH